jgi:hypothetical protein
MRESDFGGTMLKAIQGIFILAALGTLAISAAATRDCVDMEVKKTTRSVTPLGTITCGGVDCGIAQTLIFERTCSIPAEGKKCVAGNVTVSQTETSKCISGNCEAATEPTEGTDPETTMCLEPN